MLTNKELIWKGKDNSIDLQLFSNDSAVDLSPVTQMKVVLDDKVVIDSTDAATGYITWSQAGYDLGEIRITAGTLSELTTGAKVGRLIVYDGSNINGIVWDDIPIRVMEDPASTA